MRDSVIVMMGCENGGYKRGDEMTDERKEEYSVLWGKEM